jgi:hypothetical protein
MLPVAETQCDMRLDSCRASSATTLLANAREPLPEVLQRQLLADLGQKSMIAPSRENSKAQHSRSMLFSMRRPR